VSAVETLRQHDPELVKDDGEPDLADAIKLTWVPGRVQKLTVDPSRVRPHRRALLRSYAAHLSGLFDAPVVTMTPQAAAGRQNERRTGERRPGGQPRRTGRNARGPGQLASGGDDAAELPLEKLAVTLEEAAAMLSMSRDSFDRHVREHLRLLRVGGLVLVPTRELAEYVDQAARRTIERDTPS
jgi:hypothetical protein